MKTNFINNSHIENIFTNILFTIYVTLYQKIKAIIFQYFVVKLS